MFRKNQVPKARNISAEYLLRVGVLRVGYSFEPTMIAQNKHLYFISSPDSLRFPAQKD